MAHPSLKGMPGAVVTSPKFRNLRQTRISVLAESDAFKAYKTSLEVNPPMTVASSVTGVAYSETVPRRTDYRAYLIHQLLTLANVFENKHMLLEDELEQKKERIAELEMAVAEREARLVRLTGSTPDLCQRSVPCYVIPFRDLVMEPGIVSH